MGVAKPAQEQVIDAEWPEENGNPRGLRNRTDEFSFLLRPSPYGVGVFAAHAIRAGTSLRLYDEPPGTEISRKVRASEVQGEFIKYCIPCEEEGWVIRPVDFCKMDMVWFLNHSDTPNARHSADYIYRAIRDIAAGEEILIDYNAL